jgi:hypothetical protein
MVTAVAAITQQVVLMSPEYAMSGRLVQAITSQHRVAAAAEISAAAGRAIPSR